MNTYWPFPVNAGTFAHPVTKRGWWNSENGFVKMLSRPFHIGISCSVSPKILRRYFLYDRRLLLELSRCIWESLKIYYQHYVPGRKSVPGAVIAIQTFRDLVGFNPHGHVLITDD